MTRRIEGRAQGQKACVPAASKRVRKAALITRHNKGTTRPTILSAQPYDDFTRCSTAVDCGSTAEKIIHYQVLRSRTIHHAPWRGGEYGWFGYQGQSGARKVLLDIDAKQPITLLFNQRTVMIQDGSKVPICNAYVSLSQH